MLHAWDAVVQPKPMSGYRPYGSVLKATERAQSGEYFNAGYTWDNVDELLGEHQVDINVADSYGDTALYRAARAGSVSTVRLLVAAGARVSGRGDWTFSFPEGPALDTPLMVACAGGHHEVVAFLVDAGAEVNTVYGESGDRPRRQPASAAGVYTETALTNAAEAGCLRSVQILLDGGASVDAPPNSWAPLHAAIWGEDGHDGEPDRFGWSKEGEEQARQARQASHDTAVALLRAGADVNALDHLGRSPLVLALRALQIPRIIYTEYPRLDPRLISTLLRKGARLPAPDDPTLRASASNVTTYIEAVRQAGSIARYETARRAPFVAALTRCGGFPIPSDMISRVVAFWLQDPLDVDSDDEYDFEAYPVDNTYYTASRRRDMLY